MKIQFVDTRMMRPQYGMSLYKWIQSSLQGRLRVDKKLTESWMSVCSRSFKVKMDKWRKFDRKYIKTICTLTFITVFHFTFFCHLFVIIKTRRSVVTEKPHNALYCLELLLYFKNLAQILPYKFKAQRFQTIYSIVWFLCDNWASCFNNNKQMTN